MNFINDPLKTKKVLKIILVVAGLSLIGNGVLGYFYYKENKNSKNLVVQKQNMENQKNDLQKQIDDQFKDLEKSDEELNKTLDDLEKENESLKSEKKDLENQISDFQEKITKAKAYSAFLKHLNAVIETHSGFDGWTDAEFQTGKSLAEATGDASFVTTVNWAWYETSIDSVTRAIRTLKEIQSGIEGALN